MSVEMELDIKYKTEIKHRCVALLSNHILKGGFVDI